MNPLALKIGAAAMVILPMALSLANPDTWLAPGNLAEAHSALTGNCLACHAPFGGTPADRCTTCHEPKDVGLRKTTGETLIVEGPAFHQSLIEADCTACHGEHRGPLTGPVVPRFSHQLLRADLRESCAGCHTSPSDPLHSYSLAGTGDCAACHSEAAWKPATFAHEEFFLFDRDHPADCASCHEGPGYETYTCYNCHEHTPRNIRSEHVEEGITDFEDCARCHRSGDEHDIRGEFRKGHGDRGERDDD